MNARNRTPFSDNRYSGPSHTPPPTARRIKGPRELAAPPGSPHGRAVCRLGWELHCAYNRDSHRASEIESDLVAACEAAGVAVEWEPWRCPLCGGGQ